MKTLRLSQTAVVDTFRSVCLAAVPATNDEGETVESWIQVLKTGEFYDPRYGDFVVTKETLDSIVENFDRLPLGVPGDYDHSFQMTGSSLASGWVRKIELREEESLWTLVSWTSSAVDAIRAGEYRFISPEYTFDYIDERGEHHGPALLAFALTNRPFLEGMAEVTLAVEKASAAGGSYLLASYRTATEPNTEKEESDVDLKKLARALRLSDDATEEEVLARAEELSSEASVTLSKEEHAELVAAAEAGKAAAQEAHEAKRETVLASAIREGKIPPAHKSVWARSYDSDPAGVSKEIEGLPIILARKPDSSGTPGSTLPPEVRTDAPKSERVHALALAKQKDNPDLSYRDAVSAAYREVDDEAEGRAA